MLLMNNCLVLSYQIAFSMKYAKVFESPCIMANGITDGHITANGKQTRLYSAPNAFYKLPVNYAFFTTVQIIEFCFRNGVVYIHRWHG